MKPHAFVAMPFGVKRDGQGNEIDFSRVYSELIQSAEEGTRLEEFARVKKGVPATSARACFKNYW